MLKPCYQTDTFFHWTEIKVRFRDLDPLNHVNNSVFSTYFEEARIDFIQQVPEFNAPINTGKSFVLVHIEIDFIKPVLFNDTILVGSAAAEFGVSSIKGFQAIYSKEDKELKAVAKSTGVWFDIEKQRPVRLPDINEKQKYLFNKNTNG